MTDQPKKFTVERSKWLRGNNANLSTKLRITDGRMCCLGFVSLQCGVPAVELLNILTPAGIRYSAQTPIVGLLTTPAGATTDLTSNAMEINDDEEIDDATREAKLSALFDENDSEMEFVP